MAQERTWVQRRCGTILEVDSEALRRAMGVKTNIYKNQQKSVHTIWKSSKGYYEFAMSTSKCTAALSHT